MCILHCNVKLFFNSFTIFLLLELSSRGGSFYLQQQVSDKNMEILMYNYTSWNAWTFYLLHDTSLVNINGILSNWCTLTKSLWLSNTAWLSLIAPLRGCCHWKRHRHRAALFDSVMNLDDISHWHPRWRCAAGYKKGGVLLHFVLFVFIVTVHSLFIASQQRIQCAIYLLNASCASDCIWHVWQVKCS